MNEPTIARAQISGHEAEGTALLVQTEQGTVLCLVDYRFARGAPDLRVYLSSSPDADVNAPGTIDLGRMTQFSGNADLSLPSDADLRTFRTVVVYCQKFSVEFGRGTLGD